ncbi:MAG: hypothetical protein HY299_16515 [Verrucomicrobia bacterium]|nr:hypothetical protein [Verrucomicrobiota bacterium]
MKPPSRNLLEKQNSVFTESVKGESGISPRHRVRRAASWVLCLRSKMVVALLPAILAAARHAHAALPPPIAQEAFLKGIIPQRTRELAEFGRAVAVSGNTVVVGAPRESAYDTLGFYEAGAAYVFVRNGVTWQLQAHLKGSNTDDADSFGWSLALSGDWLIVGAPGESSQAFASGAAYIFERTGTNWIERAYLKAPAPKEGDRFGVSVSTAGDTVVVGANQEAASGTDPGGNPQFITNPGAAYVFAHSAAQGWKQQASLRPSNAGPGDLFGTSVAITGGTVVVGAPGESSNFAGVQNTASSSPQQDNNSANGSGAAYVFTRNETTWTQQAYLKASNGGAGDAFGISVAADANTIVVGAWNEDNDGTFEDLTGSGAAYVFTSAGGAWSQQALLRASNPEPGDGFGVSVAVAGNAVTVGAFHEASDADGVNGDESNNQAYSAGAAYLFDRSGTPAQWNQSAYVKASHSDRAESFGSAVALSQDTLVAGAFYEGVFSESFGYPEAGAAYVFARAGSRGPKIAVEQLEGATLSSGISRVDWGNQAVGGNIFDADRGFVIKNIGGSDLAGLEISLDGPNASDFLASPISQRLSPGESTNLYLLMTPTALGARSAMLHVISNDNDESSFDIALTGFGVPRIIRPCDRDEECVLSLLAGCFLRFETLAPAEVDVPASMPLGSFYALQSLMNQTEAGRRWTGLYWRHTGEIVQIVRGNSALGMAAQQVLVDFHPALAALLTGKGSSAHITQPMIDRLNQVWNSFAAEGSPALRATLTAERARFDGFQAFVGKSFSEWAALLQVPAPEKPFLQAFHPLRAPGRFRVQANSIPGLAYSLWRSPDPATAGWTRVADAGVSLGLDGVELLDANAVAGNLFYQVRAEAAVSAP